MRQKLYETLEILGYIGAIFGIVFSAAWFFVFGFWAMRLVDPNNVILQFAVLLVPSFLGIGLIVLSNRVVDYSKRKLGKKY